MNDRAIKVDQIDGGGFALVGREQGKPRPRALAIQGPQASARPLKFVLLNRQNSTFVTESSGIHALLPLDEFGLRPTNFQPCSSWSQRGAAARPGRMLMIGRVEHRKGFRFDLRHDE